MSPSVVIMFNAKGDVSCPEILLEVFPASLVRGRTIAAGAVEVDVADISDWIPIEYEGVCENFGFVDCRLISLSANLKSAKSCYMLGDVSVQIARHIEGLVCLDYKLSHWTSDQEVFSWAGVFEFRGSHYLTANAMASWVRHRDFGLS